MQTEGVSALVAIAKDILQPEDAKSLVLDMVSLIMSKQDASEGAKIASLLII